MPDRPCMFEMLHAARALKGCALLRSALHVGRCFKDCAERSEAPLGSNATALRTAWTRNPDHTEAAPA